MDWKRLVQFALLGSNDLEQYAILLVRVSVGLFFAISGANKLFVAGGTKPVYDTLVKAKIPFPRLTAYFVSGVEFVCGSLLAVGFLSSPDSVALLIDMAVATVTNAISTMPKGLSPLRMAYCSKSLPPRSANSTNRFQFMSCPSIGSASRLCPSVRPIGREIFKTKCRFAFPTAAMRALSCFQLC